MSAIVASSPAALKGRARLSPAPAAIELQRHREAAGLSTQELAHRLNLVDQIALMTPRRIRSLELDRDETHGSMVRAKLHALIDAGPAGTADDSIIAAWNAAVRDGYEGAIEEQWGRARALAATIWDSASEAETVSSSIERAAMRRPVVHPLTHAPIFDTDDSPTLRWALELLATHIAARMPDRGSWRYGLTADS